MGSDVTANIKGERKIVELDSLENAPYNPHDIQERDVETVTGSIREYGYLENIIVNQRTGRIVAGHTRIRALKEAGYGRAEVLFIDVGEIKEKRLNILLNHQAKFDDDKMSDLINELNIEGVDVGGLGLDEHDLDKWLDPDFDETDVTEDVQDEWEEAIMDGDEVKEGEVIELGRHKLICGDATMPEVYEKLFDHEPRFTLAFYSPPYNIGSLNVKGDKNTEGKYMNMDDKMDNYEYFSLLQDSLNAMMPSCNEVLCNVMIAADNKLPISMFLNQNTSRLKDIVYWVKTASAPHIQGGVMNNRVELILAFGNGKRRFEHAQWKQGTQPNIIEGPQNINNAFHKVHKAVFPLYLPVKVIEMFTEKDDIVLDPFGGTGTTLIAAERTGRTCYMIEKDPNYCKVIRARYEQEVKGNGNE